MCIGFTDHYFLVSADLLGIRKWADDFVPTFCNFDVIDEVLTVRTNTPTSKN